MSRSDSVVVTGLGPVTAIGVGREKFAAAIRKGASGKRPITQFATDGYQYNHACEVTEVAALIRPSQDAGRAATFALTGALLALDEAGVTPSEVESNRVAVIIGTCDGEAAEADALARDGITNVNSGAARRFHQPLSQLVASELGWGRAVMADIGNACAAGNYAIGYSLDLIRCGVVDIAVCGGADALSRKLFSGFHRVGTIAPGEVKPFDRNRKGILTGEGAGMVVMERLEHAIALGVEPRVEVAGYGVNSDAGHPVAPDPIRISECIRAAHADAHLEPEQVSLISAHGTGTPLNDRVETKAIRMVFGNPPAVTAVKSMIGHSMGASAAIGAIASAVAMEDSFTPPTIGFSEADDDCDLPVVTNAMTAQAPSVVQNHGFGFGGVNSVLLLSKR
ncbi:beta-ketoacyl-[acyl-carrier-protein] synthase family protein [Natronoglycomyces albus]|uniref:3-oxoacyl-[acyl-carrier-protein] synthase 1 n=1 Tax=Natronoglycomyces albus TaxID=2811108 RepID=A0A895XMB5_9ACTN|nr:beta-ketoacyl-[acyl-carrier-protein] synthase family protein [Natronoglycomyces albus]QSB06494.1 beta-ketoacyl-[acyl-carrier-protein] synthase family protein [Natronoglycomyces albus]